MKQPIKQNYVDNVRLCDELTAWKALYDAAIAEGANPPRLPEYVGECILKIAQHTGRRHNFNGYTYLEDMIGDAVVNCCKYIHNFNPHAVTKSGTPNAFSYITRSIFHSFSRFIESEKRQQYYKMKAFAECGGFDVMAGGDDMSAVAQEMESSGIGKDFMTRISEYEERMKERIKKKREQNQQDNKPNGGPLLAAFMEIDDEKEHPDCDC